MKRAFCILSVLVLAPVGSACDKSPTPPSVLPVVATPTTTPATTPAPVAPSVTRVDITGNVSLATIGETSQLTATATLSDGTMKDVSSESTTKWSSSDPSVIAVSSSGLLTVVALGRATIIVAYQSKNSFKTVTVTPPGTFVIAGGVREPGRSGVAGVRVTETASGRVAQTNSNGAYSFAALPTTQAHLKFDKDGYEPVELDATPTNSEAAMQHVIRLAAGDTVTPLQLAPHDLSYSVGTDRCYPCRLIRVTVPIAGTLNVRVTWTEARQTLNLWAGGQIFTGASRELVADVPVKAGEAVMYLGSTLAVDATGMYVPFTIATALP